MNFNALISLTNSNIEKLKICRSQDSISTELDGETVILHVASGVYSGLDSVGTFIWNAIEQKNATFGLLRDAILEHYEVDREQCEIDLVALLKDLAENGLILVGND